MAGERRLELTPIGVVHSPFTEKMQAPRQPNTPQAAAGTVELFPGRDFEHALEDLTTFRYIWLLFWFDQSEGWRPKVLPPRSEKRRGVFATRSPYRPNPLGLSVVKLEKVDGLVLHVSALDMLDGTPVLDLKPYVAYADALTDADGGWLETGLDPQPGFEVDIAAAAVSELAYLRDSWQIELEEPIRRVLALGPQQHPYRRIRRDGSEMVLAVKDFRARFTVEGRRIVVHSIASGYRPRELATNPAPELEPHRAFVAMTARRAGALLRGT
jgi:tRNA (adenine37-N6)-methyltransferase